MLDLKSQHGFLSTYNEDLPSLTRQDSTHQSFITLTITLQPPAMPPFAPPPVTVASATTFQDVSSLASHIITARETAPLDQVFVFADVSASWGPSVLDSLEESNPGR